MQVDVSFVRFLFSFSILGLMISGFAKAAIALNDEEYKKRAINAADFIKKYLYTDKKRLLRSCYTENGKIVQMLVL